MEATNGNYLMKAFLNCFEKQALKKSIFTRKFPSIRMDRDPKKRKWKIFFNKYLLKWRIETKFVAKVEQIRAKFLITDIIHK